MLRLRSGRKRIENKRAFSVIVFIIHYLQRRETVQGGANKHNKHGHRSARSFVELQLNCRQFRFVYFSYAMAEVTSVRYRNNCHHKSYDSYFRFCLCFFSISRFLRYPSLKLSLYCAIVRLCNVFFVCVMKMVKQKKKIWILRRLFFGTRQQP